MPVRTPSADPGRVAKAVVGQAQSGPNPRFEVTKDSPSRAELAVLAKTNRPPADTIGKAQAAFGDVVARGGKILVTTSAGKGGKPVLTLVPPGFDPGKPAKVQTHYHGDRTSVAEKNSNLTQATKELLAEDPQRLLVLPEAGGNINANGTNWSNVSSQKQTTDDALAAAGVTQVSERTVSAHSAGGRALARALGKSGGVEADRVVLLDCLYEPAATQIRDGLKANVPNAKEIVVVRGTNEMSRADAVVRSFPGKARKIVTGSLDDRGAHETTARFFLDGRTQLPVPVRAGDHFSPS